MSLEDNFLVGLDLVLVEQLRHRLEIGSVPLVHVGWRGIIDLRHVQRRANCTDRVRSELMARDFNGRKRLKQNEETHRQW